MLIANTMDQLYPNLIGQAIRFGERRYPRDKECVELRPGHFTLIYPERSIYTGISRRLNFRFLALETLSYIAGWGGRDHADLLSRVNPNIRQFVNGATGSFDGAYGPRLAESMDSVCRLLSVDPDTRQAVASIWAPSTHVEFVGSKDVPCTQSLHFLLTDNGLACVATMRSNDLNWGTPYDVPAFCAIQMAVAHVINAKIGHYVHQAGSLHLYTATPPQLSTPEPSNRLVTLPRLSGHYNTWLDIQVRAHLFCVEAHQHLVRDSRIATRFKSTLENEDNYWRGWADMVRFQWNKVDV